MTFKYSIIYLLLITVLMSCDKPIPSDLVQVSELNILVDKHEVTAIDFEEFCRDFDMRITSDSTAGWWFSADDGRWLSATTVSHLNPTGVFDVDSLAPAVQVSWGDACAYCNALNGRLPTTEEWVVFSQGSYSPGNIWEGYFPLKDEGMDGFKSVSAPVKSFQPNELGIYDLYGNVWEWTSSARNEGNYFIKSGSFLSDYNSGGFLPDYELSLKADSLRYDLGFRCVYDVIKN